LDPTIMPVLLCTTKDFEIFGYNQMFDFLNDPEHGIRAHITGQMYYNRFLNREILIVSLFGSYLGDTVSRRQAGGWKDPGNFVHSPCDRCPITSPEVVDHLFGKVEFPLRDCNQVSQLMDTLSDVVVDADQQLASTMSGISHRSSLLDFFGCNIIR
jgi:hypothetical protein